MTPQELKNSILQLAIQGKLVEQRPEEGTAEELYRQIQVEKQRLVKAGKIKKEKPLPEIAEDEMPFDIPESWRWVRVGEIVSLNPKNELDDHMETSFIPMTCIADGFRNYHTSEIRLWGDIKKGFTHFSNGDIGIAKITPCFQNRKSVIFSGLKNGFGAGTTELSIVRVIDDTLSRLFLLWFFKSAFFIENGVKSFTGTAGQQRIHKDYLSMCLFPLPPIAEQKRIASKIQDLLPYIDRYEQAWNRLEAFNKRFPDDMKKSILQLAIQGKLVEQRPEEGTADDLFQQIQAEKQILIRAGQVYREKELVQIREEDIPFDIPKSWIWCRLGELSKVITKGSSPKWQGITYSDKANGIFFITSENVGIEQLLFLNEKYVEKRFNAQHPASILMKGDLLTNIVGASIGRTASFNLDIENANINQAVCLIRLVNLEVSNYIIKYLNSVIAIEMMSKKSVDSARANLSLKSVTNLLIPLPPLAEQKRIVAKLEELLPLSERLK